MAFKFNPFTGNFDIDTTGASTNVWETLAATATASSTLTFDTIALTSFNHLEYIINYEDPSNNRKSVSLTVVNNNGTIKEIISRRLGANLDIDVTTDINAGNFELKFINNEAFDIDVSTAKLLLA
jgi:hypothetical protein